MSFFKQIGNTLFEVYQENGTRFVRNNRSLPNDVLEELRKCAGEIYLTCIPQSASAEQLTSIASELGELYQIRFKVNFAGNARGFAYMQYVNPGLMNLAIARLPELLRSNGLSKIQVVASKNSSKLLLVNIKDMTSQVVIETLRSLITFQMVNCKIFGQRIEYQIVFGSNEDAVRARRVIITQIYVFGPSAKILWDRSSGKN